ncbi:hypothetical protein FRC07_011981 [Ceratobasidium sp. 392]|nr:hypothetical protein FRC07_011981 [Ceratobasidium sp. 392]
MGKVATYCQISGCSPEVESDIDFNIYEAKFGPKVHAAIRLVADADEMKGLDSLSIIGPLDDDDDEATWLEPDSVEEALALPEGCIRAVHGCSTGGSFDMGWSDGPNGDSDGALISYGPCFFVLTIALPVLEAATGGRVSPRRLWKLAMRRGHFDAGTDYCIPGVAYGAVAEHWDQFPWMFGDITLEEMEALEDKGAPEDIAEIIRSRGYWMWMRPDRFPIEPEDTAQPSSTIISFNPAQPTLHGSITALPVELLHSISLSLSLSDIISLAAVNKAIYNALIGNADGRDALAKAYMRSQTPWYLPHGEAELKWWHERKGDDALGWNYLQRCYTQSHSMRNRRRIWKAAESIEEECEKEECAEDMAEDTEEETADDA